MQAEMEPEYRPTPKQQESTNRAYWVAFGVSVAVVMALLIGIPFLVFELKLWLDVPRDVALQGLRGSPSAGVGGMSMSLAQLLAIVFCRRKGVSLEARFRERWNVSRQGMGIGTSGEPIRLRRSRILPGIIAGLGILGILLLWLSQTSASRNTLFHEISGLIVTLGGIWGLIMLCFGGRQEATVDETGITFARRAWYLPGRGMLHLAWRDINHVEIVRKRGVMGKDVGGSLTLHANEGATYSVDLTYAIPEDRIPFLDRVRSETRRDVESVTAESERETAPVPTPVYTTATKPETQPLLLRGNR